jgi:type III restriction enzyme
VFNKGFISLNSRAEIEEKTTTYERAVTEKQWKKQTAIRYKMYSAEEVALDIFNRFKVFDLDEGTEYRKKYPYEKILAIIKNSLLRIGENKDLIHEQSRQNILQGFGVIGRKKTKSLRYKIEAENVYTVKTEDINKDSVGIGALRREHSIFFDDYSTKEGNEEDRKLLKELLEDETLPVYSLQRVENAFNFKTPVNVVFTSYKPERDFIKRLISEENAKCIDAWIKAPDMGFYTIEYSWRKGEHPKQGGFNPDFFVKVGNHILVIEIKQDGDLSAENKAKLRYAKEHFNRLNTLQSNQRYYFKFLSPESYDLLFQRLREGKYRDFTARLEASLDELSEED